MPSSKPVPCLLFLTLLSALGCSTTSGDSGPPAPSDPLPALQAVPDAEDVGRIVDSTGREVLLRGVNVNAHVEYWQYDEDLFTAYPFTAKDADMVAAMGWNMVRLLLSWSRVEPTPGEYDAAYLDEIAESVSMLRERGVYTLIDLHQDAWGPSLVAPPDEVCVGSEPAGGWDGAPEWATFDDDQPRCEAFEREFVPAVRAAWRAFFDDMEGPGGVGIRTRYVQMFAHVVSRFANDDSVAGYDVMNEPNVLEPRDAPVISEFYEDALVAMRRPRARSGHQSACSFSSRASFGRGPASQVRLHSSMTIKSSTRRTSTKGESTQARSRRGLRERQMKPSGSTRARQSSRGNGVVAPRALQIRRTTTSSATSASKIAISSGGPCGLGERLAAMRTSTHPLATVRFPTCGASSR